MPLAEGSDRSATAAHTPNEARLSALLVEVGRTANRGAFEEIYLHYFPLMIRFFARRTSMCVDPDDLAQQVLQTVWQKAVLFSPEKASASPWIFTIARNCWVDAYRRHRSAEAAVRQFGASCSTDALPEEHHLNADAVTVMPKLKLLSQSQASVVHACFFLEKTHQQIATELEMPLGTVKSCLRLAYVKMRNSYKCSRGGGPSP